MVQITNTIVAAAIIVPALAAPVLEAREPKGFGSVARVAGKVASGASLGLTVGGLLQGREELESREPRITGAQAKAIAKGAGAIAHTAKSGIEFGAAVAPLFPHRQQRRDIEAREPRITGAQAKAFAKGAGAIAHTAKSGIEFGAAVAPLFPHKQRRDVEELDARARISPSAIRTAGHALAGAAGFAGTVALMNTQRQQRDYDDFAEIDAREPKFRVSASTLKHAGHAVAGAAGFAGTVAALNTQQQRDFDDSEFIEAREPGIGGLFKGVGKIVKNFIRDEETGELVFERDFDDSELLEAREPGIGGLFKGVGKIVKNFIRDEETGEVYVREFDGADLDAREPEPFLIGGIVKTAAQAVKHFIRDEETGEIYVVRNAADIDELD